MIIKSKDTALQCKTTITTTSETSGQALGLVTS